MKGKVLLAIAIIFCWNFNQSDAFGSNEKVLLQDVQVLTLYGGKQTNARRGSSIPQLECTGGTAYGQFYPKVVQCYNRGFDGSDVQWECKTDMDNDYRFGNVEVSCEGYDYPDDPYILKGSCGLRYTIDYTKQGHAKAQEGHHYGQGYNTHGSQSYGSQTKTEKGIKMGDIVFIAIICIAIFILYKICLSPQQPYGADPDSYGAAHDPPPPYPGNSGPRHRGSRGADPPGFRPEFYDDGNSGSCAGGASYTGAGTGTQYGGRNRDGPGFWTGMAGGGLLGYLFGNRNTGYGGYNRGYGNQHYGSWGGHNRGWGDDSSWFGGGGGSNTRTTYRSSSSSSNSGTRTASGFGGTSRR